MHPRRLAPFDQASVPIRSEIQRRTTRTKAPISDIFVGDDGRIWIQLSTTGRPTMTVAEAREEERLTNRPQMRYREPVAFDVLDPDGRFLGHVKTPDEFRASPEPIFRGWSLGDRG